MSPRRSSRARTNPSQQQPNSSSSSISSGRADNSARPNPKITSPRSSAATRSLSSEEIEGSAKPQPRRTRSSQEESKEIPAHHDDEEDEEGEEEVTRCICGNLDYPGMPSLAGGVTKSDSRNTSGPGFAVSASMLPEDAGGLFIQCDVCKVWQHGGCVGIMDEAMSPEEYFCEQCRKELHKIKLSTNGYDLASSQAVRSQLISFQAKILPIFARARIPVIPVLPNTPPTRESLKEK